MLMRGYESPGRAESLPATRLLSLHFPCDPICTQQAAPKNNFRVRKSPVDSVYPVLDGLDLRIPAESAKPKPAPARRAPKPDSISDVANRVI
jgi:hypothetical protein